MSRFPIYGDVTARTGRYHVLSLLQSRQTKVIDSRLAGEGRQIRRRRECLSCGERFTTFEAAELIMPMVVKSDRTREPFDEAKLRAGMTKALEKRPVALEAVEEA